MMIKDSASFRDRSGYVFSWEGKIYRWISPEYLPQYQHLMDSGLYRALVDRRLMIAHKEVVLDGFDDGGGIVIQPSAYNIQFLTGYVVLIDTLSFDFYQEGSPWGAYGQYCRHFLAPLMLMSNVDFRLGHLMQSFIDGIPLDLASTLMKGGGMAAQMHIHAHAKSVARHNDDGKKGTVKQAIMKKSTLVAFCDSLRKDTAKLQSMKAVTEWGDYYSNTNYSDMATKSKEAIVRDMLSSIDNLKNVWDFGANDGRFSRIANELDAHVVAFDIDENAVTSNWKEVKVSHRKMLPLILDLSAPSPAIGFANAERKSLFDRQKPNCIMMLAVIHHMAISNNLPFEKIAAWIAKLTDNLIIEFVPKDDSQIQVLLATRKDIFPDYDCDHFETAFGHLFKLEKKIPVEGSKRIMYLWRK